MYIKGRNCRKHINTNIFDHKCVKFSFLQRASLLAQHFIFKSMDHPFLADHLSQIHEADTLYDSRLSSLSHLHQESLFQEQRSFARNALVGWGMEMGELPYSRENEATLKCLAELVAQRQKDLQFRGRVKEDMSALQFERDKFRSFAEQAQRTAEEHLKKIGTLQNELNGIRLKSRKGEAQFRKEREEDRKTIAALRTKNEQVLHEVKKKEAETARIRQQMKKSVGEKGTPAKNTFDVFIPQKQGEREGETQKYGFLLQRNERELSLAMKENALLRQKLFQIREALVRFNAWIDRQIFGEQVDDPNSPPRAYDRKFYLNHNLLFKKESLTEELEALIEVTKDGLIQLRDIQRGNCSPPRLIENRMEQELNFRKKPSRREIKTDRMIGSTATDNRPNKTSITKRAQGSSEHQQHHSPRSIKHFPQQILTETTIKPSKNTNKTATQTKKVATLVTRPLPTPVSKAKNVPFEDDLISEVSSGHDSSIISHISIEQMGKSRFDKWDILYQEQ